LDDACEHRNIVQRKGCAGIGAEKKAGNGYDDRTIEGTA
jgi:hypothetical protein